MVSFPTMTGIWAGIWLGAWTGAPVATTYPSLSETGLYKDIQAKVVSSSAKRFDPQFPLWSDGLGKTRWIALPPGARIDNDQDSFVFPVGTRFWKEFAYDDASGNRQRLETRFFEKTASGWNLGTYLWNDDQSDATLVPEAGLERAKLLPDGRWYSVPSRQQCLSCHSGGRDLPVGFTALQMSAAPLFARHPESIDLERLANRGALTDPVKIRAELPSGSATARAATGYLYGNCASCHRPEGSAGFTRLFLHVDLDTPSLDRQPVYETAFDHRTGFPIPGFENDSYRIKPGVPDQSAVLYRLWSEKPGDRMPPVGSTLRDPVGVGLIERWIREAQ